jgi:hypothetical protein
MRKLPQFQDSDEFPIFEVVGGGRIFSDDIAFDDIYNQELYDKIKEVEGFKEGGELNKMVKIYYNSQIPFYKKDKNKYEIYENTPFIVVPKSQVNEVIHDHYVEGDWKNYLVPELMRTEDKTKYSNGGGVKQSNVYEINGIEYLVSEPTMYNGKYTGWNCYKAVFEMKDGERHLNYDKTKTFGNREWFKNEDILKGKIVEDYFADYFAKGGGVGMDNNTFANVLLDYGFFETRGHYSIRNFINKSKGYFAFIDMRNRNVEVFKEAIEGTNYQGFSVTSLIEFLNKNGFESGHKYSNGGGIMADGRIILRTFNGVGGNKNKTYKLIKDDRDSDGKPYYTLIEEPSGNIMAQGDSFEEVNGYANLMSGKFSKGGGVRQYAGGGIIKVGDNVVITDDSNENYYDYLDRNLIVTNIRKDRDGDYLYDLEDEDSGEELPFSFNENEIELFAKGGGVGKIPKSILVNVKKLALRDGYDYGIYFNKKTNEFSFSRLSMSDFYDKNIEQLVAKVITYKENGILKVKVENIYAGGGGVGKKYYWITMDRDYIDEYIDYASHMNNMFEGEIYTQAPNKVAFDTENDMFAFTSMIENHNIDNDLEEGDEEYIHYEELFNGEPRENIFDKISSKNYAGGGEIYSLGNSENTGHFGDLYEDDFLRFEEEGKIINLNSDLSADEKGGWHDYFISDDKYANEISKKLISKSGSTYAEGGYTANGNLRKRFEGYTDEELQIFNGDNEETLKNWNREDAIEEAIHSVLEESDEYAKGGKLGEDLQNYSDYNEFYDVVFEYIKREENLTEAETKNICIVNESIIEAEFDSGSSPRFTGDVILGYLSNERGYMAKGGEAGIPEWSVTITSVDNDTYDWIGFAKDEDEALYLAEQEAGFDSVETGINMITDEKGNKIEYAGGGEVEDWMEEALESLIEETGYDDLKITYVHSKEFYCEGSDAEYRVFETEEDAEETAIERVREDLEEIPEAFNQEWLSNFLEADNFFREILEEQNYGYATDIMTEDDDLYANRLIREMVDWGIMTEEEAMRSDAEQIASDNIQDFVNLLTDDQCTNGAFEYYANEFGKEEAYNLALQNNLIDFKEASENAVMLDGIGHFLSSFDGQTIYLSKNAVAYRTN